MAYDYSAIHFVLQVLRMTLLHKKAYVVYGEAYSKGCQSAGGNEERGGATVLQFRPALRCLTDIPRL